MLEFVTKQCTKCKQDKELLTVNFLPEKRHMDGLSSRCRECCNEASRNCREKYKNDLSKACSKENLRLSSKRWREKQDPEVLKEKYRNWDLKKYYKLSPDDINTLLERQKFICKICSTKIDFISKHVDHNHKTGEIRGLLCSKCNFMLGFAKDSIEILYNGIKYLKEFDSTTSPIVQFS
jgi:hypothetical protein